MPTASERNPSASTILLVDDIPSHLKLGTMLLSDAGFRVLAADSGEAALRSAKLNRPDAILSDVVMEDMDGFGLCRKVREDESLCAIPVVLTSVVFKETEDSELATFVGANALVHTTPDFSAEIRALLKSLALGAPSQKLELGLPFERAYSRRVLHQMNALLGRATRFETRYRAVLDHTHDAVALVDLDGYVLEASHAWQAIIKAPPASMRGKHLSEYISRRPAQLSSTELSAATDGHPNDRHIPFRASDGAVTWLEFAPNEVALPGESTVMTIGRDVSERVTAAAAFKAGEARYKSRLERLPGVVWSTDSRGEISFATPNVARVSGFSSEEVLAGGMAFWHSRVHPEDRLRIFQEYLALFAQPGVTQTLAYRWQRKDGEWIWLQGSCSALVQPNGLVTVEGLLEDVTVLRDLEERLRQAQKMEAVGQLTSGLAHDFNNLLTVIMANAHMLGSSLAADESKASMARDIGDASLRAAALTRQLLSFSRKQTLQRQVFAPTESLKHFCGMLRRPIGEDIELEVDLDPHVSRLEMDPGQLEQVVVNLVVNARDAMHGGGKLTVRLADTELTGATAGGPDLFPGRYVMLSVSDTGQGISPEVQRHIFEPFFTTKHPDRGTGLGLATVQGIVKQAGGAITVETEVGRGSTFRVYLPRVFAEAAAADATADPDAAALTGSECLLLVEDDPTVAQVCRTMLETAGYRVISASSGAAALAELQVAGPVDLVIADVVMPAGNGPQAIEAMRALRPALKVLYISGHTEHSALAANVLPAPENLLTKPFTSATLLARVRSALSSKC